MKPSIGALERRSGFYRLAKNALRFGRVIPALNTALTLYDLYQLMQELRRPSTINTTGWTLSGTNCGGGKGINSKTPATPCG